MHLPAPHLLRAADRPPRGSLPSRAAWHQGAPGAKYSCSSKDPAVLPAARRSICYSICANGLRVERASGEEQQAESLLLAVGPLGFTPGDHCQTCLGNRWALRSKNGKYSGKRKRALTFFADQPLPVRTRYVRKSTRCVALGQQHGAQQPWLNRGAILQTT